ncbi:MAG: hypothetical protein HY305_06565 [Sphingobacteriales bacterium]|nr:hypothetical protein [Sphingobacteriales bacterium]
MNKKVLAIYYSQSGQLGEIIDNLVAPLIQSGNSVEKVIINPAVKYPFPWKGPSFFGVMPDCVLSIPTALSPFDLKESSYDLIILGYQAWFLSPSIPVNSLLHDPKFQQVIKNTPVVTITGARNMWINAFERLKKSIQSLEGKLVGNIALVDKHPNPVSFVTIFQWMFKGKKQRYLNIFPLPGVSQADITNTITYGNIIQSHLDKNTFDGLQAELVNNKAVEIKYRLMYIESKAGHIFKLWANFISKRQKKAPWLVAFKYYLLIALFIAAPIILTVDALFFKPFLSKRIKEKKQYYLGVN